MRTIAFATALRSSWGRAQYVGELLRTCSTFLRTSLSVFAPIGCCGGAFSASVVVIVVSSAPRADCFRPGPGRLVVAVIVGRVLDHRRTEMQREPGGKIRPDDHRQDGEAPRP